jgi:hypothetical protein
MQTLHHKLRNQLARYQLLYSLLHCRLLELVRWLRRMGQKRLQPQLSKV